MSWLGFVALANIGATNALIAAELAALSGNTAYHSRISRTTSGKYDQVLALSQSHINSALKDLFSNEPQLHTFSIKNTAGSITDAAIGPPEIALDVLSGANIAIFYINILSGHLKLNDLDSGHWVNGMPNDGWDLKDCRIAFKVSIGTEDIMNDDLAHRDIMDQIHGKPEDYSLSRLYMDLSSADLSSFIGAPESKLPDGVIESNADWVNFFGNWMLKAHNHKLNRLGYAVNFLDPKDKVKENIVHPTFLPTSNQIQTYEWRNESNGKVVQGRTTDNAANGNNCLLYLQQTLGTPIPDQIRYDWTGNLVDDQKSGTLLISRKLFWDGWLLPVLQELNYTSLLVATGAHCSKFAWSPNWEYKWQAGKAAAAFAGRKDASDAFYAWKPKLDSTGTHGFIFKDNSRCEDRGGFIGSNLSCFIECHKSNEITFHPGNLPQVISIKGTTGANLEMNTSATGTERGQVELNWGFEIAMTSNSDTTGNQGSNIPGGLLTRIVNTAFPSVTSAMEVPTHKDDSALRKIESDMSSSLDNLGLDAITKSVDAGLEGARRFILPGTGTFAMANPTFNNNGDLLVDIKYQNSQTKRA